MAERVGFEKGSYFEVKKCALTNHQKNSIIFYESFSKQIKL